MKKSRIILWILFSIFAILVGAVMIFYIDLANGSIIWLFVGIAVYVLFIVLRILFRNKKMFIRQIAYAVLFVGILVIMLFAHPKVIVKPAVVSDNLVKTEVLTVSGGKIQGVYNNDKDVEVYTGIPYAKAPVGELRWKEPQDYGSWSEVMDCSYFKSRAMQPSSNTVMSSLVDLYAEKGWHPDFREETVQDMSEDCLYLNVWKPKNATNAPVLVYIHGGSLTSGTAAHDNYNGEAMAKKGVIMVTIAYRLGIFGYLALDELANESANHTTGNYGLLDQVKALKWVHDNATYFGGNKDNITIAGESAGSSSVSALCATPLAKGLFNKAIGESSSLVVKTAPHTFRELKDAKDTGNDILKEFNCKNVSELRQVDAKKLVKTQYKNDCMTVDGYALPKTPYEIYEAHENNEEALLNGFNVLESDGFVVPLYLFSPTNKNNILERLEDVFGKNVAKKIYDQYEQRIEENAFEAFNEIISVYWFMHPHYSWTKMAHESGVKVYRYQFTKENGYYGTYHSGEIIYAYGNVEKSTYNNRYNEEDIELSRKMLTYWANFCKTGNPNDEELPQWLEYQDGSKDLMELGSRLGMKEDPYNNLYPLIDEFVSTIGKIKK